MQDKSFQKENVYALLISILTQSSCEASLQTMHISNQNALEVPQEVIA